MRDQGFGVHRHLIFPPKQQEEFIGWAPRNTGQLWERDRGGPNSLRGQKKEEDEGGKRVMSR